MNDHTINLNFADGDLDVLDGAGCHVEIVRDGGDWPGPDDLIELLARKAAGLAVRTALEAGPGTPGIARSGVRPHINIVLSSDAAVMKLNLEFRGKNKPTNVLSFPFGGDDPQHPESEAILGDVVLACETIAEEARIREIPVTHHLAHLIAHGVLHLLGYDHQNDGEASRMEGVETEVLKKMKIPDPHVEFEKSEQNS